MNLPAVGYLSNAGRTTGEEKTAFEDQRNAIAALPGGSAEGTLTIAAGVITPGSEAAGLAVAFYSIDTEVAAPSDDLTNIAQTFTHEGMQLWLRCKSAARVVTVKHSAGGIGQISLTGSADLVLSSLTTWLILKRTGTLWEEQGRFAPIVAFATIGGNNSFAGGTRMIFDMPTPPTTWTRDGTVDDRVIKIQGTGTPSHGGAWPITGLTHTHTHAFSGTTGANNTNATARGAVGENVNVADTGHTHFISGTTGGASSTPIASDGNWRPLHRSVVLGVKS